MLNIKNIVYILINPEWTLNNSPPYKHTYASMPHVRCPYSFRMPTYAY